jgi:hypothetical protein
MDLCEEGALEREDGFAGADIQTEEVFDAAGDGVGGCGASGDFGKEETSSESAARGCEGEVPAENGEVCFHCGASGTRIELNSAGATISAPREV